MTFLVDSHLFLQNKNNHISTKLLKNEKTKKNVNFLLKRFLFNLMVMDFY